MVIKAAAHTLQHMTVHAHKTVAIMPSISVFFFFFNFFYINLRVRMVVCVINTTNHKTSAKQLCTHNITHDRTHAQNNCNYAFNFSCFLRVCMVCVCNY